ncbi:MAG TPA: VOC family protein [Candidatus Dormibacteraeota bacterium]|nr:VOC family protein [Candidatus Dormibacteraeota bacterium]
MSAPSEPKSTGTKKLDTMDHVAVPVGDVKRTVEWYTKNFDCKVAYQDETWALVEFANIRLAFVLPAQHPPHFAVLGEPAAYGAPKTHRDGTRSVYLQDPSGNEVEILALK